MVAVEGEFHEGFISYDDMAQFAFNGEGATGVVSNEADGCAIGCLHYRVDVGGRNRRGPGADEM